MHRGCKRTETKGILCDQGSEADTSVRWQFGDLKAVQQCARSKIQELQKSGQQTFLIGISSIALNGNALSVAKANGDKCWKKKIVNLI